MWPKFNAAEKSICIGLVQSSFWDFHLLMYILKKPCDRLFYKKFFLVHQTTPKLMFLCVFTCFICTGSRRKSYKTQGRTWCVDAIQDAAKSLPTVWLFITKTFSHALDKGIHEGIFSFFGQSMHVSVLTTGLLENLFNGMKQHDQQHM